VILLAVTLPYPNQTLAPEEGQDAIGSTIVRRSICRALRYGIRYGTYPQPNGSVATAHTASDGIMVHGLVLVAQNLAK
jgi:hypothetical protein